MCHLICHDLFGYFIIKGDFDMKLSEEKMEKAVELALICCELFKKTIKNDSPSLMGFALAILQVNLSQSINGGLHMKKQYLTDIANLTAELFDDFENSKLTEKVEEH